MNRRTFLQGSILALAALAGCARRRKSGRIVIGVRTSNCQIPFYVADHRKLYARHGLEVSVQLVPSNTEIIEGMKRGDLQMGSLPITTAIAAIAQGARLHIVAGSGRGSDGILVRKGEGIASLADLRGKKVATIRASILDVLLRYALDEEGLDPERGLELVYFSKLGDMISALKTRQVDATSNTDPFMTDAERQDWGQILIYYTAYWPDHPCCIVLAGDAFAQEQPEALRSILSAHCEAVEWANQNVGEAAQILVDALDAFDRELVASTLSLSKMRLDCSLGLEDASRIADLMARYGLIDAPPAIERLANLEPLEEVLAGRQ